MAMHTCQIDPTDTAPLVRERLTWPASKQEGTLWGWQPFSPRFSTPYSLVQLHLSIWIYGRVVSLKLFQNFSKIVTKFSEKIGRGCVGAHGWFNVKRLYFSIFTIICQNLFFYLKVRFKYQYPPNISIRPYNKNFLSQLREL